jgi:hypothetical protein
MTVTETAGAAVFIAWFALTVVVQLPFASCKRLRLFEPTGHLLPGWHFFSPKPVIADIEVLYRYTKASDPEGQPTEWQRVYPYTGRPIQYLLYNPHRKARKVLFHCASKILSSAKGEPDRRFLVSLTIPYLLLLDRVTAMCPHAAAVQFRIDVERHGPHAGVTAFLSPMHATDISEESEEPRYAHSN